MPSENEAQSKIVMGVLQAVVVSAALGILGACWKTYMDVHDMKRDVASIEKRLKTIQGKQDWLYHYDFPKMDEEHDDGNGQ